MNTVRNLPVLVRGTQEGGFIAECLLLPECRCFGATRQQALETMQIMVQSALRGQRVPASHYEVVYLAVARAAGGPRTEPITAAPGLASTAVAPAPPEQRDILVG